MDLPSSIFGSAATEGYFYYFTPDCPEGIPDHVYICVKHREKRIFLTICSSQTDTAIRIARKHGWSDETFPVFRPDAMNKSTEVEDDIKKLF